MSLPLNPFSACTHSLVTVFPSSGFTNIKTINIDQWYDRNYHHKNTFAHQLSWTMSAETIIVLNIKQLSARPNPCFCFPLKIVILMSHRLCGKIYIVDSGKGGFLYVLNHREEHYYLYSLNKKLFSCNSYPQMCLERCYFLAFTYRIGWLW